MNQVRIGHVVPINVGYVKLTGSAIIPSMIRYGNINVVWWHIMTSLPKAIKVLKSGSVKISEWGKL